MSNRPNESLEEVLATLGSSEQIRASMASAFGAAAGGGRRVVIVGCGHLGTLAFSGAKAAGLDIVAVADNNPARWHSTFNDVPVLPPEEAVTRHNHDAFFVVGIYNGSPVRQQLLDLGCTRVVSYPMFFWHFSDHMPEEDRLELPYRILPHVDMIRGAYARLADAQSKVEYAAQVHWRCTLDYTCLPVAGAPSDMYFDSGIVPLSSREVFVDCGAFDGDSIRAFLRATSNAFDRIVAIEPDPGNLAALDRYLTTLPGEARDRISVLPFGVGDRNERVHFNASGTVGSRVSTDQTCTAIECRRLDDLLRGRAATMVKMDIEGAEPHALRGLVETMRHDRPILAICAYHKCEHLWTLPPLMLDSVPDYRLYLRRYAEDCWETVYYAVPLERLVSVRNSD